MKRRHLLAAALAASAPLPLRAQSFPERPVRFVVPYQPGGSTDTCSRLIAENTALRARLEKIEDAAARVLTPEKCGEV